MCGDFIIIHCLCTRQDISTERRIRVSCDEFKETVKLALVKKDMSLQQLSVAVTSKTGMYCDQPLLSKMLNGTIKHQSRPKIVSAIYEILGIEE